MKILYLLFMFICGWVGLINEINATDDSDRIITTINTNIMLISDEMYSNISDQIQVLNNKLDKLDVSHAQAALTVSSGTVNNDPARLSSLSQNGTTIKKMQADGEGSLVIGMNGIAPITAEHVGASDMGISLVSNQKNINIEGEKADILILGAPVTQITNPEMANIQISEMKATNGGISILYDNTEQKEPYDELNDVVYYENIPIPFEFTDHMSYDDEEKIKEWFSRYVNNLKKDKNVKDRIIEMSNNFENIALRFIGGRLVYKPNPDSDVGKIEMRIADLADPFNSEFNLSGCGGVDKFLSISTGYSKVVNPHNSKKWQVFITPKFFVERNIGTTAARYGAIIDTWTSPYGVIQYFEGWDDYWYNTTLLDEEISGQSYFRWWLMKTFYNRLNQGTNAEKVSPF